jgi:ribosomal protein S18 acetylase RimI-like enzyme
MVAMGCEEVVLEAESDNIGALKLYEKLGFVRDEKLGRYYLHGGRYYFLFTFVIYIISVIVRIISVNFLSILIRYILAHLYIFSAIYMFYS